MPRNGSGVYSPPAANYPAVTGTTITAANRNAVDADIATALTGSVAVNGESVITANLPMAGFKLTGLGAGASSGDSLRYQQLFTTSAVTLLGALNMVKGADIASASTLDLTAATGNAVHVTGTTTITAVTLGSGMWRLVIFDGALTLTHHATNNNLPGAANITTAAGDRALYWADGTTVYCMSYVTAAVSTVAITAAPLSMSTARLLGRTTASTGAIEEISVGTGLTLSSGSITPVSASTSAAGIAQLAAQSDMETPSSSSLVVTAAATKWHPGVAKAWAYLVSGSGVTASHNLSSVTLNGTGDVTYNWSITFSSTNYASVCSAGIQGRQANSVGNTTTSTRVQTSDTTFTLEYSNSSIIAWGDI